MKDYLLIGQVAERVGRSTGSIRDLERRGILPAPQRDMNGYRIYDADAVRRIKDVLYPKSAAS